MGEMTVNGVYRPCPSCRSPIVSPFPAHWIIELVKEGPAGGPVKSWITPHRPDCVAPPADPQPGIAVRLPGGLCVDTSIGLPAPPPPPPPVPVRLVQGDAGFLFTADPDTVWPEGWTLLGYTAEGMASRDGVTWDGPGDPPPLDGGHVGGGTLYYDGDGDG